MMESDQVSAPPQTAAKPVDDEMAHVHQRFSKILLVDDSKFLADTLAIFFQLDGFSARATYGGQAAIDAFEDEVPDIAFVDIDMPGMNGLDVARHVRASKRARGTLLVALSGWEEDEQRREAFNAGYDHFLAKPVDVNSIRAFMSKLAGGTKETQ